MKTPTLPPRFYWTIDSLAAEYQTDADTILYYLDAGFVSPCALVPWWKLEACGATVERSAGAAPHVCVMLKDYQRLPWQHTKDGSTAMLVGELRAFSVEEDTYKGLFLSLPAPLVISRNDLVVTDAQKQELEAMGKAVPARVSRPIRERNLLRIIAAILRGDTRGPYVIGKWVRTGLDLNGTPLGRETVASAIKDARAEVAQLPDEANAA